MKTEWNIAYQSRQDLKIYKDNGLALFALSLHFGVDDLDTIAAESITDGGDDKKCDVVYINKEDKYAVLIQCYQSQTEKQSAPCNKACDLNTAIGWLLQRNLEEIPDKLRSAATDIRSGFESGEIDNFYIWYVHNLPESRNVEEELKTVQQHAATIVGDVFKKGIQVQALEVGTNRLEQWYEETLSPILVNEEISIDTVGGYNLEGPNWTSFSTAIPTEFLYNLYKKFNNKIFSANVRDYLGSRASESNINYGIKDTINSNPENFWVFNNGLTILTHNLSIQNKKITVSGISIVNGAQTTGAIGSLSRPPANAAWVQARFVCPKGQSDIVQDIIRYNNSQNKVEASDFRSTDSIQKRLRGEFSNIPDAEYDGGRRGSASDIIKRRANLLSSYTVGQALACFHQDPIIAYNQKTSIWVNDRLYSKYFNESTNADHIVCAYSLVRCLEERKRILVQKSEDQSLSDTEKDFLDYFRRRGSIFLLASAIVMCMEIISGKRIPDTFRVRFKEKTSPKIAESYWDTILDAVIPFSGHLSPALEGGLKNSNTVKTVCATFRALVQATYIANKEIYERFSTHLKIS
ncbi:AIPR family protein [Gluconobacter kondonii]|uniref:AIPR family protein n=1 Tax=Gluconobacter kondonii TaxID=941463 RepID=UPI001B8C757E|nr:AIPR family protein [Gluconobacter kondonii]MBS1057250.1 AIPR family protein [Gluconobacter kondonii]